MVLGTLYLIVLSNQNSNSTFNWNLNSVWYLYNTVSICATIAMTFDKCMMTSSNGNIFRVTGNLCGEFTGLRWIPRIKGQWRGALMFSFICTRINGWVNNDEAGDLGRHRTHNDVTVMDHGNIRILILQSRVTIRGVTFFDMDIDVPIYTW